MEMMSAITTTGIIKLLQYTEQIQTPVTWPSRGHCRAGLADINKLKNVYAINGRCLNAAKKK
jgi:hypothetical protein